MNLKYILIIFLAFLFTAPTYSQIMTEQEAREELDRRGINEEELRFELMKRGIDLDNIDVTNPHELIKTREIIEEVMKELETRGGAVANEPVTKDTSKVDELLSAENNIKQSVKDGATIDEAISEELQEIAKEELPEAKVYGHHLFRNNSVKFYRKTEDAKPPDTYIIGSGDQVSISIWGQSEANFSLEVSKEGYIKPPKITRIYVAGLTIANAKKMVRSKISKRYIFKSENFDLNISTARTINVNITGEVFNVGTYSLSALNTAFNALVAAGGSSDIGSIRRIKLARAGQSTKTLDIYKYLSDPLINEGFYLKDNDYIVIPVMEKVVEIRGAINRPFKYEMINNEGLNELIDFAGGLKSRARKGSFKITRIINDQEVVINVDYKQLLKQRKNFSLLNGDLIEILEIENKYENIVTINGAVEFEGEYSYKEGMKISDLLNNATLKTDAILSTAYLMRLNDDNKTVRYQLTDLTKVIKNRNSAKNIKLQRGDILTVRSKSAFVDLKKITVEGAVRIEGEYPFNGGQLKVSDAIFLSGGLKETATDFGFIMRDRPGNQDVEYISINLKNAINNIQEDDILLHSGDKLIVYDIANYSDIAIVNISGAVRNPKKIKYDASLTIKKALLLAGGVTFDAALNQIDIFRIDFEDNKKTKTLVANVSIDANYNIVSGNADVNLKPFDQIIVRKAPEFELQRNVRLQGEIKFPGDYALLSDNTKITEILNQAGGMTKEGFVKGTTLYRVKEGVGFVILNLEKAYDNPESSFNIILQKGDVITIPKINDLVTVIGAVNARDAFNQEIAKSGKFNFAYEKGKNAKYYVDNYAGGVSKGGMSSRIKVIYPNGEVKKTKKFLFIKSYPHVEPGSIIYVGYKDPVPETKEGESKGTDWGKVLGDSVAQATSIVTLLLLLNSIK
ncbi:MAG: SLBB domain-containing protein [Saprospiraceae bacterium]